MPREQKALRSKEGTVCKRRLKEAVSLSWVAFQQSKLFMISGFICGTYCTAGGLWSDKRKKNSLGLKAYEQNQTIGDFCKWLWPPSSLVGTFRRATRSCSLQDKLGTPVWRKGESQGWGNFHPQSLGTLSAVCACCSYDKTLAFCHSLWSHLALRGPDSLWAPSCCDPSAWAYRFLAENLWTVRGVWDMALKANELRLRGTELSAWARVAEQDMSRTSALPP